MSDIEDGVHFRADPEGHDDAVWHRIAFRFLFAYFVLYALPTPTTISLIKSIPGITFLRDGYLNLCQAVLPWVATRVLHVSGPDSTRYLSAGGDSILHYVYWFCIVALATLATIIWSILDRKRSDYHVLHIWLRVLLCYTLAFALFWYGFRKVFPLQFQPVDLARMIRPISEITPRGLMWGFMGTSPPYVVFTGLVNCSAARSCCSGARPPWVP